MAKKVVVPDENAENTGEIPGKKKKRHWCCTCGIILLIVTVVILAAAFGVGWWLGDKYSQEYLNMPLGDTLGVVRGLYWTKDDDVVDRPYSDEDLGKFYDEIKTNILLKQDADIDFNGALKTAINSYLKVDGKNAGRLNADGNASSDSSSIADVFVNMVSEVFVRENIDINKLNAYSESSDNYIFNLNDRQLAAFINSVLSVILENADKIDALKSVSNMVSLKDVVSLKQIRFGSISKQDELGQDYIAATTVDLTVWVGLQDVAGQIIVNAVENAGFGWVGGFARWIGNVILPENVYATISMPLNGEGDAQVTLNNMNEEKRENTYKLVNGILGMTGGGTIQDLLKGITDQIKPVIETAMSKMDFTSAGTGTIKLDLIGALADMASESMGDGQSLTKADFMYMLQAVLGSDPDKRLAELEPFLYTGWYKDGEGKLYHDPANTQGLTAIDYTDEFVREIESKYALRLKKDGSDKVSLDELLAMLGISTEGEGGSDGLVNMLDAAAFRAALGKDISELKLTITDRMLGALLAGQVNKLIDSSTLNGLSIQLDALTFITDSKRAGHLYSLIAAEVNITGLMSQAGDSMLTKLASNVLPERILLSVVVDITECDPSERDPISFKFNDYANTDRVISTLAKLIPDLDLNTVSSGIGDTIIAMLTNLRNALSIDLVPYAQTTDPVNQASICMPDIFTIITKLAIVDNDGTPILSATELKDILNGMYDTTGFSPESQIADDYSGFIADIADKYYLNPGEGNTLDTFGDLTSCLSASGGFNGTMFYVTGDDPNKHYLAYDTRTVDQLKPVMNGAQIGALIKENMPTGESMKGFSVNKVETLDNGLKITLAMKVKDLLPGMVGAILDINVIYATVSVDMSELNTAGDGYQVSFKINNMSNETYQSMLKLINHYNGESSFNIDERVGEFGKILYAQLNDFKTQLGDDNFMRFTSNGMEIAGFYDFLAKKLGLADSLDRSTIKNALQGMYKRSAIMPNSNNYALADFAEFNPSDVTTFSDLTPGVAKTDIEFNGFFNKVIKERTAEGEQPGMTAIQTIAISASDSGEKATSVRNWLKTKMPDATIADNEELLVVTFIMDMDKFANQNESASGFTPDDIYATVAYRRELDGTFTAYDDIILNNMSQAEYVVLSEMMGLNADGMEAEGTVNIKTVTKWSAEGINDMIMSTPSYTTTVDITPALADGVGDITCTLTPITP